jgi:hypothetical protein
MSCKKCGTILPDNTKFCDKCGALQTRPDTSSAPVQKGETNKLTSGTLKSGKFVKIRIIGIVALVIIAAVFFYIILGAGFFATQKVPDNSDTTIGSAVNSSSTSTSTLNEDYVASYSWEGNLVETFSYRVTNVKKFTMLSRNFNVPLVTKFITNPYIEFHSIKVPNGTVGYLKNDMGTVSLLNGVVDTNAESKIKSLSRENEVGIFKAGGFEPGIYTVVYNFQIHPPIEYDQSAVHLNIKLFDQNTHPAYDRIKILVPEKSVREIYFSPSHLTVKKNNGMIVATGKLAENEALDFEVILDKDILETLSGFPKYTDNVTRKTESAYPNQYPFIP